MNHIKLIRLTQLPRDDLQPLLAESRKEGFKFLDRLVLAYVDGSNQFGKRGEALFGVYSEQRLIAIGGLNRDPYLPQEEVGRVRHLYVLSAWRKQGIGRLLVQRIIDEAKETAHKEGDRIKVAAQAEIDQEINRAKDSLRNQVSDLAVAGASKILGKEVDAGAHKAALKKLIEQI